MFSITFTDIVKMTPVSQSQSSPLENRSRKYLWETMFRHVKDFKDKHGHCNVPRYFLEHPKLGAWVQTQRTQYRLAKEGKHNNMYPERIEKLNAIDFDWSPRGRHEIAWDERINQLRQYKEQHGDCSIPREYPPNQQLAHWVANQRRQFMLYNEGNSTSLSEKRVQALNELGFVWRTNGTRGRKPKGISQETLLALKALKNTQFKYSENFQSSQSDYVSAIPHVPPQSSIIQKNDMNTDGAQHVVLPQEDKASEASQGSMEPKKCKWLCDFCKKALFDDFDEACEHEKNCQEPDAQVVESLLALDKHD